MCVVMQPGQSMTWRDRPYAQGGEGGFGGAAFGLGRPTRVVAILLIANLLVFLFTAFAGRAGATLASFGQLVMPPYEPAWQVWRWVSYQYLHADPMHIFFNMIGLYFLGPPLERLWGGRKFFYFYTFCGVVAGIGFALLQLVAYGGLVRVPLVGASGCVLGCLAACAYLFPQMMIILLFFPVPIRAGAAILALLYTLMVAWRSLSDGAHLAGMGAGLLWVMGQGRWPNWWRNLNFGGTRASEGAWQRKMREMQDDEERVDRILDKIRKHGMGSLTWLEKRFLKKASERRREFDEQQSRRY
jgi:membrane associated rhomboid family serine protease